MLGIIDNDHWRGGLFTLQKTKAMDGDDPHWSNFMQELSSVKN